MDNKRPADTQLGGWHLLAVFGLILIIVSLFMTWMRVPDEIVSQWELAEGDNVLAAVVKDFVGKTVTAEMESLGLNPCNAFHIDTFAHRALTLLKEEKPEFSELELALFWSWIAIWCVLAISVVSLLVILALRKNWVKRKVLEIVAPCYASVWLAFKFFVPSLTLDGKDINFYGGSGMTVFLIALIIVYIAAAQMPKSGYSNGVFKINFLENLIPPCPFTDRLLLKILLTENPNREESLDTRTWRQRISNIFFYHIRFMLMRKFLPLESDALFYCPETGKWLNMRGLKDTNLSDKVYATNWLWCWGLDLLNFRQKICSEGFIRIMCLAVSMIFVVSLFMLMANEAGVAVLPCIVTLVFSQILISRMKTCGKRLYELWPVIVPYLLLLVLPAFLCSILIFCGFFYCVFLLSKPDTNEEDFRYLPISKLNFEDIFKTEEHKTILCVMEDLMTEEGFNEKRRELRRESVRK